MSPNARLGLAMIVVSIGLLVLAAFDVVPIAGAAIFAGVILLAAGLRCLKVL